jgi:DNA polymerase-3 subunit beta
VELVSGGAVFHLRTLPSEDFPKLPEGPPDDSLRVPAAAFVETVGRVARSASRDETRPHLTGVLVTVEGSELRMVATDSYRLSVKETTLDQALSGSLEANIPARTLQELARVAAAAEADEIRVAARENQVVFSVGDTVLSSRLVEGRFGGPARIHSPLPLARTGVASLHERESTPLSTYQQDQVHLSLEGRVS